ncbi:Holliday junction DNA helicase subunit RuvA [Abditibacterium utsteinense]|uniref:Holliday junction branch migration complex subunit RuvA n=1 Tax=Abditibacterium utsteinense TaxID=1960156 RepID=A0A2S8SRP3_9BACT|nr:Holliday junction branch migration protein RuvA [Abditibacterium utsteinense]PQV63448.1 Holliday junction DNA helicase subunit RuvA [Abditibacterium utsteinense]
MISQISGLFSGRGDNSVIVNVGGLSYEVLVPLIVEKALDTAPLGEPITLETVYYLQIDQNRATPVLLGFQNQIQREFFQKLLLVPRMGPKTALATFGRPVSTLAAAIEGANYALLQTLPGVGKQKARDIVATLQGKLAKFALMQDSDLDKKAALMVGSDVAEDALQLLVMMGYKRPEAEKLVQEAMATENAPDAETLVRVIYRMKQEKR